MPVKHDVDAVITRRNKAIATLWDNECAEKSRVDYSAGRFYVCIARTYPDGSVGLGGRLPTLHRYSALLKMIEDMEGRASRMNAEEPKA